MSVSFWIQVALFVYNWSSSKERRGGMQTSTAAMENNGDFLKNWK